MVFYAVLEPRWMSSMAFIRAVSLHLPPTTSESPDSPSFLSSPAFAVRVLCCLDSAVFFFLISTLLFLLHVVPLTVLPIQVSPTRNGD